MDFCVHVNDEVHKSSFLKALRLRWCSAVQGTVQGKVSEALNLPLDQNEDKHFCCALSAVAGDHGLQVAPSAVFFCEITWR